MLEFAVFDTETTGFDPNKGDRLLEIGVVRVDVSGRELARWSTLVNPGAGVPLGPTSVHGIERRHLVGAPRFAEVAGDFITVVAGAHLTAHNAVFDMKFLAAEFVHAGVVWPAPQALCTLLASRRLLDLPSHKLGAVAAHLGVEFAGRAHSALDDAAVTAKVLSVLLGKLNLDRTVWPAPAVWPSVLPSGAFKRRPAGAAA